MCRARSACQDDASLNEHTTHSLAVHTHALRDRPHRDSAEVETYSLGRFIDPEPRVAEVTRCSSPSGLRGAR